MRPARPIRGSNGPFPDPRFDRLGPSGSGWLVRAGSDLPGRDGWFRVARNRGFPHQIPPFYGREMTDFGRFPGFRISDAPPTYSPVLMYLEIQVLAGFPELEFANFANTFRCFEISGNPGFVRFPAAPNRDFREYVLLFRCTWKSRFWEASRSLIEEIPPF